jgi:hypothetical protein
MAEKDIKQGEKDTVEPEIAEVPYSRDADASDERPPLYVSGFGVMGQGTPDVATGSTPVTRKDD